MFYNSKITRFRIDPFFFEFCAGWYLTIDGKKHLYPKSQTKQSKITTLLYSPRFIDCHRQRILASSIIVSRDRQSTCNRIESARKILNTNKTCKKIQNEKKTPAVFVIWFWITNIINMAIKKYICTYIWYALLFFHLLNCMYMHSKCTIDTYAL